jgi:hypothetical protein
LSRKHWTAEPKLSYDTHMTNTQNRRGYAPFGSALKRKQFGTSREFAKGLGIAENTYHKLASGTIVAGVPALVKLVKEYPDLYDLAVASHLGPRPTCRQAKGLFGEAFTRAQGEKIALQVAVDLGVNLQTVYRLRWMRPIPGIALLRKIAERFPSLYDLAAVVHFGLRPKVKMAK